MQDKLKKIFIWIVIAYPLSWVLEKALKIPVFQTYQDLLQILYQYLHQWWDWIFIAGITYLISKNIVEIKYETMELIRRKRFIAEVERWEETPFVPPIVVFYLFNPPQAVSSDMRKIIDNRFYQLIVSYFRDRVYINAKISRKIAVNRQPLWKIIGYKEIGITIFVCSLLFSWFSYVSFENMANWIYSWERFTIPGIIYFALYISMKIQGYIDMRYSKMDRVLKKHLGEEPNISWREFFPDQDKGKTLLAAWEAEREKRQRYTNLFQGNVFVTDKIQNFTNPALAPYPYPSTEIPEWTKNMELYYKDKLQQWADEETKPSRISNSAKVIDFNKRRKKSI